MKVELHPEAVKAINIKAKDLLSKMIEKDSPKVDFPPPVTHGSAYFRPKSDFVLDARDLPSVMRKVDESGTKYDIFEYCKGKAIGFNDDVYLDYEKFLLSVFKQKVISRKVSFDFVSTQSFKWFLKKFKNNDDDSSYIDSLMSEILLVIKNYEYKFEVVYLDIEKPFKIGNVSFEFMNPDSKYFDGLKDEEPFKKEFSGKVYATYSLNGVEQDRGEMIALKECYKAVDVLKLFSRTIIEPNFLTCFDIDRRSRVRKQYQTLIRNLDDKNDLTIKMKSGVRSQSFGNNMIDDIENKAHYFVQLINLESPNELQRMLVHGLNIFSEALSNPNIYYRIVEIFSVWESLLLKDSSSPITESICEFGAMFVYKEEEKRKEFKSFLQKMYNIRCDVVHHAKRDVLNLDDLVGLQSATIQMMASVINGSFYHNTKLELLDDLARIGNIDLTSYANK